MAPGGANRDPGCGREMDSFKDIQGLVNETIKGEAN
jgi:hypothetical protein